MLAKFFVFVTLPSCIYTRFVLRPIGIEFKSQGSRKDGCSFRLRHYKIGDTWHPELYPFGIQRCVLCSCIKDSKRQGSYGKLACQSTRHRCPRSACTNPIYKPNQCCPTCPPEFVSLMHESRSTASSARPAGIARAHFTLVKTALHISIRYEGDQKPKLLTLLGPKGNILQELNVNRRAMNGTKICFLWSNMDSTQIAHLNDGKVTATLRFRRRFLGMLTGEVKPHKDYSEEAFESLLQADDKSNAHMGALTSFTLSRKGKTLHIKIHNSPFTHVDSKAVSATLQFTKTTVNGPAQVFQTVSVTSLQENGGQAKATWENPSDHNLKLLARGLLTVTLLVTAGGNSVGMSGPIVVKSSCNTIYAALAGREGARPTITGASGYISFDVTSEGKVNYKVILSGLMQPVSEINLEMSRKRVVKRISRAINPTSDSTAEVTGVWARPSAAAICALFNSAITVVVRTALYNRGELRGFVRQLPYGGPHLTYHETPRLLSGNAVVPSSQTGASGLAWFSLDRQCNLYYHLLLIGVQREGKNSVTADLEGFAIAGEEPLTYEKQKHALSTFDSDMISGSIRDLSTDFIYNTLQGKVYVQVSSTDNPHGELRTQLLVSDGEQCRQKLPPQKTDFTIEGSCVENGERYFNGEVWSPSHDPICTTCSCKDATVSCFPVVCLPLNCSEQLIMMPERCCPVCPVLESEAIRTYDEGSTPTDAGCFVEQGKKFYPSGAVWHPYASPFGYMKCTVCTCKAETNEITWNNIQCPRLDCPKPFKMHPSDCCAQCPVEDAKKAIEPPSKVCKFGQNTYPNNARWTPYLPPFGVIKCVTCQCQNGRSSCSTVTCPAGHCKTSLDSLSKSCCVPCSGESP
ncbi:chordin isoform X1 [Nematostella vectensis]|uniref:chordin isoform X1 n=2 Tax=Nematostella vectensis TaxID=45351 RepID=UPI0020773EDA|nr:chordin isoform X1 [Nematostella vectensis]